MKNRYFENQVRKLSEQYARLSIDFKNETNPTRAFELHAKAEKIKRLKTKRVNAEKKANRKKPNFD